MENPWVADFPDPLGVPPLAQAYSTPTRETSQDLQGTISLPLEEVRTSKPFSLNDILGNLSLSEAARTEMQDGQGAGTEGMGEGGSDHTQRLREAAEMLDEDVHEETVMSCELTALLIKQLEESRNDVEVVGDVLTQIHGAEAAYVAALSASQRSRRRSKLDKPTSCTMTGMAALPAALLPVHQELASSLQPLLQPIGQLLAKFNRACKEVAAEFQVATVGVDRARQAVADALTAHAAAVASLDRCLTPSRQHAVQGPVVDPWGCERQLLQELRTLLWCVDKERSFLQTAFSRAKDLELQRSAAFSQVLATIADSYSTGMQTVLHAVQQITTCATDGGHMWVASNDKKLQELTRAGATTREATSGLASKQADSVQAVNEQLFCSPEIVRQGELQPWDETQGRWRPGHAVLTRAGYLWLLDEAGEGGSPATLRSQLSLARLQFEAGQAPCFYLVRQEQPGWFGSRPPQKLFFKAPSIEECCEWAISIREAIASAAPANNALAP